MGEGVGSALGGGADVVWGCVAAAVGSPESVCDLIKAGGEFFAGDGVEAGVEAEHSVVVCPGGAFAQGPLTLMSGFDVRCFFFA